MTNSVLFYLCFVITVNIHQLTSVVGETEWVTKPEFASSLPDTLQPFFQTETGTRGQCFIQCSMKGDRCSSVGYSEVFGLCKLYSHNNLLTPLPKLRPDTQFQHQMFYKKHFCPVGWEADPDSGRCYLLWNQTLQRPAAWKICDERLASEMVTFQTKEQRGRLYKTLLDRFSTVSKWWTGYAMFSAGLWPRPVEEIEGYLRRRGGGPGNDILDITSVKSPRDCAIKCDRSLRDRCVGFEFSRSLNRCWFKTRGVRAPVLTYSYDNWFYEKIHAGRPPASQAAYDSTGNLFCTGDDANLGKLSSPKTAQQCIDICRNNLAFCPGAIQYYPAGKTCCFKQKSSIPRDRVSDTSYVFYDLHDIDRGPCPYGIRYHDVCLIYIGDKFSWSQAVDRCRQMGGMLPTPIEHSQKGPLIYYSFYHKYYADIVSRGGDSYYMYSSWVDATDENHEGNWTTIFTGVDLAGNAVYEFWGFRSGEPNGGTTENCADAEDSGIMKLIDLSCTVATHLRYQVCETPVSQSWPQDCRFTSPGREYNGVASVTLSGVPCKFWNDSSAQSAWKDVNRFPDMFSGHNYCRNPDTALMPNGPWCIRSDNNQPEYCPTLPLCPEVDWASNQDFSNPNKPYAAITASSTSEDLYEWTIENADATANPICSISMNDWCPYYFRGSCYMFYKIPKTHSDASAICNLNGWHLITLNSVAEIQFIDSITLSLAKQWVVPGLGFHLGLQRNPNVNGSLFTNWDNGDPLIATDWLSGRPYTAVNRTCAFTGWASWKSEWFDEFCTNMAFFICEIEFGN